MSAITTGRCAASAGSPWDTGGCAPASTLLPIISRMTVTLDESEVQRLETIAAHIIEEEPALATTHTLAPGTRPGLASNRWLLIGDTSEIALARHDEESSFEYRLSFLARAGDLVVFGRGAHASFEHYRADDVGRGPVVGLHPRNFPGTLLPLADRCRLDNVAFARIVKETRRSGGLTIVPHIGLGSAWRLAAAVAAATGLDITVMSAPPQLTRRVNDKLWFARLARTVLGENAIPPTYAAHGLAALAQRMRALARNAGRVVVKVPDSSGAAGNVCLAAKEIADAHLQDIEDRISAGLHAVGWHETYPLLVGLWEAPTLGSPSVQLWIPARDDGPPIIEGLFEQILEGITGLFVGSVPSELPDHWQRRLVEEAMRLATVLQHLGYFGRCSLDALLVGPSIDSAALHWIECNGRWGGVSIPLTIANRLNRGPVNAQFVVVQRDVDHRPPRRFADALRALDGLLFKPGAQSDGIIVLSPAEIETGRGMLMMACAQTIVAARALADRGVEILSGPQPTPDRRPIGRKIPLRR